MSTTNRQKFETGNSVVKGLIDRFHRQIASLIVGLKPTNLLEVGCGEGFLLAVIKKAWPELPILGLDNSELALADGHKLFPDLPLQPGDIYRLNQADASWDVVVASEILEHLDHPDRALTELRRVARRYVVLSVPWEPWFRLGSLGRGKHLRRFGNHPEHINHWTKRSFAAFVNQQLRVERVTSAFPWILVLARV